MRASEGGKQSIRLETYEQCLDTIFNWNFKMKKSDLSAPNKTSLDNMKVLAAEFGDP